MVILSVILPLKESGRLWNLYEREREHKKERKERQWVHRDEHMHREIFTLAVPTHVCETDGAQHKHNMEYSSLFGCEDAR